MANHAQEIEAIDSLMDAAEGLSPMQKVELITRLSRSLFQNRDQADREFYALAGSWDTAESAEDLINFIEGKRTSTSTQYFD
jgi:hypothetical protein